MALLSFYDLVIYIFFSWLLLPIYLSFLFLFEDASFWLPCCFPVLIIMTFYSFYDLFSFTQVHIVPLSVVRHLEAMMWILIFILSEAAYSTYTLLCKHCFCCISHIFV